jgi:CBS domain-containing protein
MTVHGILDARVEGHRADMPTHPRVGDVTIAMVLAKQPAVGAHPVDTDRAALEALQLMATDGVDALPVVEGGRLVGIFSTRDYARLSVGMPQQAANVRVGEAMTPCAEALAPGDMVATALELMRRRGVDHLAVRSEDGRLLALLARDELLAAVVAHHEQVIHAEELDQQILHLQGTYSC